MDIDIENQETQGHQEKENSDKNKKPSVILKTTFHWSIFILPTLIFTSGILSCFKNNINIGIFLLILGLGMIIFSYLYNYKDKKFILTSNKIYVMKGKEKLVTINLSRGELIGYTYTNTIWDKILNSSNISFHVNINGHKNVLNYFFLKNGKNFALYSFYQSEKYLSKIDPNYKKKLQKPSVETYFNPESDDEIDKV